jgi:hypothetical protein
MGPYIRKDEISVRGDHTSTTKQRREGNDEETISNELTSPQINSPHASRLTPHASRLTPHASRLTLHASRFTLHASRFTPSGCHPSSYDEEACSLSSADLKNQQQAAGSMVRGHRPCGDAMYALVSRTTGYARGLSFIRS